MNKTCEHGRDCARCPNQLIFDILVEMRVLARRFEEIHQNYDGIVTTTLNGGCGDVNVTLQRF